MAMSKLMLVIILSLSLIDAVAQNKGNKRQAVAFTVEELLDAYKFEEASAQIRKELQSRKSVDTKLLNEQLATAKLGQNMLSCVENVVVLDSIVVDKEKLLSVYRIGTEAGKIEYFKNLVSTTEKLPHGPGNIAYIPQIFDKVYYSAQIDSTCCLYTRYRTDDNWGDPVPLPGLEDFGYDQITPYVLTDGATLYFAAKGEESLGGYDIFMSRYSPDQGKFLKPENIGMPFNSPANDYLYVIDEANNLGWFASDRHQPEGKVCVYVFVPNVTRNVYDEELLGEALPGLAMINSIKATWAGSNDIAKAGLQRLKNMYVENATQNTKADFKFLVDDARIYTALTDFKSAKAKAYAEQWVETRKSYMALVSQLESERNKYAASNDAERKSLSKQILANERKAEELSLKIKELENLVRKEENNIKQ